MGAAIVAIPAVDDYVWKISSEKIPHLTILYLGDVDSESGLRMAEFLQHVANTSLFRFGLSVDKRGTLGEDKADVLFFRDGWDLKQIKEARHNLIQNDLIFKAYNSVDQFPEWTPHLTLGYPEFPAHPNERDYPINWVNFDRLAIWFGDFDGPEFDLEDRFNGELAMSDATNLGEKAVNGVLSHHGVKGMKWGVRKDQTPTGVEVVQKRPGGRLTTKGGQNQPAHEDAKRAATAAQKAKASTVDSLSDQELSTLVRRMNLEQQYHTLSQNRKGPVAKFIEKLFVDQAKKQTSAAFNAQAEAYGQQVRDKLAS